MDGPNALAEHARIGWWRILAAQFRGVLIWTVIAAGVISGALGQSVDAIAILAIVVLNAVIGFAQELSAARSIAALQSLTAPRANVLRDQVVVSLAAADIVADDILVLAAGDLVAADARLFLAASLRCIESALTGESESAEKQLAALAGGDIPLGDRDNMVFVGTSVVGGTGNSARDWND